MPSAYGNPLRIVVVGQKQLEPDQIVAVSFFLFSADIIVNRWLDGALTP
jgi:hypothetical protein